MSGNIANIEAWRIEGKTLEELLDHLCNWGHPVLHKFDDGWYCKINVFVTPTGAEFIVKSEFNSETAKDAAAQCYHRLIKAIKELQL
jgi:hypothetical protein